ncbi:Gfo/Idh/MocA family oxidoreductase [Echinicola marina]|uniref:Gfo/Idh/MocA family protein n=1 Tax=Echinicola marina TaxID=2859768 RepID=UPI001CF6E836|nr:Gfo/Idh/MocA family oxidoreductase [Echinicola marina]UCS95286.1 Gfo/Idh/MocA family oxidoreductase [Echinicola marina]
MKLYVTVIGLFLILMNFFPQGIMAQEKTQFAMVGLSHGHSPWFFEWGKQEGMELVGVYEPDAALANRFKERYDLDESLIYDDLDKMLEEKKPEGILVFGPIFYHLEAVEAAAPRGIHVMVEKPLATNLKDAKRMAALARENNIHLLTNYETSWYPSTEKTYRLFEQDHGQLGEIHKMVFHHGHQGPKEIGVGPEFLAWLTDPKLNGGGALVDFGCYGANIMTYLRHGERPISVRAVTKNYKPEIYDKVDDEATIIVDYKDAQGIIQASWNWPFNRKDMEVYGQSGYVITKDDEHMRWRFAGQKEVGSEVKAEELDLISNPFVYFDNVIKGNFEPAPYSLYSLENNLMVVEILDAAKESATTGKTVRLK